MWAFFSGRLRIWLLLAIALPLTRAIDSLGLLT
jgi:hypothetical protein